MPSDGLFLSDHNQATHVPAYSQAILIGVSKQKAWSSIEASPNRFTNGTLAIRGVCESWPCTVSNHHLGCMISRYLQNGTREKTAKEAVQKR